MKYFLLFLFWSSTCFASFPPNNLDQEDTLFAFDLSMTEKVFNQTINEVVKIYRPVIAARGASLNVEYYWTDPTVNAFANKDGQEWTIAMFGGLARRPEMTRDGFQLVVCHEMGHLLGGFPFYLGEDMATEGQSDFWSTQACAKRLWGSGPRYRVRAAAASQSIANALAAMAGSPRPSATVKDPNKVFMTEESHPVAQCRLDTYLAGVACNQVFPLDAYPRTQFQAYSVSCMPPQLSARPRCWFAPK